MVPARSVAGVQMLHSSIRLSCLVVSGVALIAPSHAAEGNSAPSCTEALGTYRYESELADGTLLVVIDGKLTDAFGAIFKPGGRYQFYYVYQNKSCQTQACVQKPIILIKTMKVTGEPSQSVFLAREGSDHEQSLTASQYEEFHRDTAINPRGAFVAFNTFHITYLGLHREKLNTHLPKERRDAYLFGDIPAGKSPWLKARNYQITINRNYLPQCIAFDMTLQRSTESAYVAVVEIEDGSGGSPQNAERWTLKLK